MILQKLKYGLQGFFSVKINTATVSDLYDEDEVVMQSPAMEGCMSKEVEIWSARFFSM